MRVGWNVRTAVVCGLAGLCGWGCGNDSGTTPPTTEMLCDATLNVAPSGLARCTVALDGGFYFAALNPYTGALGESGPVYERAILTALVDANEHGGVGGRCVGLIVCDTGDDVATGASSAVPHYAEVAQVPEVVAVLGPASSAAAAALGPVLATTQIPVITGSAGSARVMDPDNWFFKTVGNGALRGARMADLAWANRAENLNQRIMVVHSNAQVWRTVGLAFEQQWRSHDPEGTIQYMRLEYNSTDGFYASTTVDAIRAYDPDQIVLAGFVNDVESVMTAIAAANVQVDHWYGIWPTLNIFAANPELLRAHRFMYDAPPNPAAFEPWAAAFQEAWGAAPYLQQPQYYDATVLALLAMELSVDPTDGAELRDHLQNDLAIGDPVIGYGAARDAIRAGATQLNYEGVSGEVDFDAEGHVSRRYEIWDFSSGERAVAGCVLDTGAPCPE